MRALSLDLIFDPEVNPHSVQQHANDGQVIAMFELRRLAGQIGGRLEIEFVRAGERRRAVRDAHGVVSGAVEVFDAPGFWARKLLWFRRHPALGGPMCCTH